MASTPLYSIITVCWNDLEGLRRTRASIQSQTNRDYEWLVVDGASNDGTADYLATLEEPGLHWVSEPDRGLYDAMNKAIGIAGGEYLLFLNAGDELAAHETLQKIAELIGEHDGPDFVYGDALERTKGGELLYKRSRSHRWLWYGMFAHHQAMVYRRHAVGAIRYREQYRIGADYAFTSELLLKVGRALYFPQAVCIFEQGGVSAQQVELGRQDQWNIRKDIMRMNLPLRLVIRSLHVLVGTLRKYFGAFYRRLRFSASD